MNITVKVRARARACVRAYIRVYRGDFLDRNREDRVSFPVSARERCTRVSLGNGRGRADARRTHATWRTNRCAGARVTRRTGFRKGEDSDRNFLRTERRDNGLN